MSLAIQGSPEWHLARAGKIKASVCAALEGKHPYMKPADLVRQEVRALAGSESEFTMVPAVAHGQNMEDHARIFLEKLQGYTVEETGLVIHPKYDFIAASPDGLIGLDGCRWSVPMSITATLSATWLTHLRLSRNTHLSGLSAKKIS